MLGGDPNLPNGGLAARFPGLYMPIVDWTFNGPAPTDTQFDTVVFTRQYDFFADFPLYPLNVISLLNAALGGFYVHGYPLRRQPGSQSHNVAGLSIASTATPTITSSRPQDLPLFGPLRTLGVPESLIDVVEPFFRVLVELGYDRSIPSWEPTPARLIPRFDPGKVATDLANAIGEGINNAAALVGSPPPPSIPAPVTLAAPATETAKADMSAQVTSSDIDQLGDRIPQVTTSSTPIQTQLVSSAPAGAPELSTTATPDPSASASTPKAAKPAGQPAKPRPAVRDSLGHDRAAARFSAPSAMARPPRPPEPRLPTRRRPLDRRQPHQRQPLRRLPSNSSAGDSSGGDAGGAELNYGRPSTIALAHAICPSKPSDSAMAR